MSESPGAGTLIIHSSWMCLWNMHEVHETCPPPFFCQRVGRAKKDTLVIRDGFWPYGICSLIGYTGYERTQAPKILQSEVQTLGTLAAVLWRTGCVALQRKLSSAGEKSNAWLRYPLEDGEPSPSHPINKGTSLKQLHFLANICGFTPMCGQNFYKYRGFPHSCPR